MQLTKVSGEKEPYSRAKLCRSMLRADVSKHVVDKVCLAVEKEIRPDMKTQQVFEKTVRHLRKENPTYAAKYSLRKAMMDLGPEGFLFEQYVAAILKEYGWSIRTNQIMKGKCVSHEIDIVATKGQTHFLIEVKYHNTQGIKSDVQVAMYMHARFLDIGETQRKREKGMAKHAAWIVTNTKFTKKAIQYGACQGVKMTGWRYPKDGSLEHLIAEKGLYPITVLPSVNTFARDQFTAKKILFARDVAVLSLEDLTKRFGIYLNTAKKISKEAVELVK